MKRISVLVADDHTMVCEGLTKLLEDECEVVACVGDGHALLRTARDLKPDLILVDVGMPLLNGLDAVRELKKQSPRAKVIFLTMNSDPDIASEAMRLGASGYLLKNSKGEELLQAVRDAIRGRSYITPQISDAMEERFIRDPKSLGRPRQLSARQREVLQMLAEGRPMKDVADVLHISRRTVRFHKHQIMEELGIKSNAELVQYAMKNAIIFPM